MHHKRGRPKNRRAGCLFCKPQKANGQKAIIRDAPSTRRADLDAREQLADDGREDREKMLFDEQEDNDDYDEQIWQRAWLTEHGWLKKSTLIYSESR